jgi:GNAT superfamily N-acetyltransferase
VVADRTGAARGAVGDGATASTVAAHEQRLRALDPLLPLAHPLPEPAPDDVVTPITVDGAAGLALRTRVDIDSFAAAWSAADLHRLLARVGGPDPVTAMDALLARWRDTVRVAAAPDDPDSAASVAWPSRDTALTRTFLRHGLVPVQVLAARPAGRSGPESATPVTVRPLTGADVADAVALHLVEVDWDLQLTGGLRRVSTAERAREEYGRLLASGNPWTWVAERDGRVVGLLTVSPPERAGWVAPFTSVPAPAYVGTTAVVAGRRGAGIGATLVRHAHAALDAAGVELTVLTYNPLNPLSGPFWNRSGYRPLWTWWGVRPASRLA